MKCSSNVQSEIHDFMFVNQVNQIMGRVSEGSWGLNVQIFIFSNFNYNILKILNFICNHIIELKKK